MTRVKIVLILTENWTMRPTPDVGDLVRFAVAAERAGSGYAVAEPDRLPAAGGEGGGAVPVVLVTGGGTGSGAAVAATLRAASRLRPGQPQATHPPPAMPRSRMSCSATAPGSPGSSCPR